MEYPLLTTKLFVPTLRENHVIRPRLLEKLNEGLRPGIRLILISASAGFGKTTLVSEWAQQTGLPVAWISLDDADNEPLRLWRYVIAALHSLDSDLGKEIETALQAPQPPPLEVLATLLINDLTSYGKPVLLVLDDFHWIDARPVQDSLNFFLDHLPGNVHLLLLTRADPSLHLARRRGRGELCEIRAADLRFTNPEIHDFLTQTMKLNLEASDEEALESRTEGWIAGLQMAALAAHGRENTHAFVSAFTGDDRYIADYLVEEVLQRHPDDVRNFLLQTSILQRLSPSLCNAVTGRQDSQAVLNYLENANLFIIPLDNRREWFRYHHLFDELLKQNLQQSATQEAVHILYDKAIQWHLRNSFFAEAVEYAFEAGDFDQAAHLLERFIAEMFNRNELTTLRRWGESLPTDILAKHPVLCSGLAWAANATNHPELNEKLIRLIENHAGMTVHEFISLDEESRRKLPAETFGALIETTVQRARLVLDRGDAAAISEKYSFILPYLSKERDTLPHLFNLPSALRPPMDFMVALSHELQGNAGIAVSEYKNALLSAQELGNMHIVALTLGHLGQLQIVLGELNQAEATFGQAIEISNSLGSQPSAFFGIAHVGMGILAYERNDLETARLELEKGLSMGRLWNSWEALIPGYVGLAQLRYAQEDVDGAFKALEELRILGKNNPALVVSIVDAWQAYFHIRVGLLAKAEAWARHAGYSLVEQVVPAPPEHASILALLLLAQVNAHQALPVLEQPIAKTASNGLWGSWIKLNVLLTIVYDTLGQHQAALERLLDILNKAKSERYFRTFIDEGERMRRLIDESRSLLEDQTILFYANDLLSAYPSQPKRPISAGTSSQGIIEPLSRREMEVLRLLATGTSNAEIARNAFISLNTVKKHLTSINAKLGTTSRLQAVEKARNLKLID